MDQVVINATTEFLNTQISALQEAIEKKDAMIISLQDHSSKVSQRDYATAAQLNKIKEEVASWTREELRSEDITVAQAQALANICGFTLSQNYDVTMTVEHTFTVCVEPGEDLEDILHSITFTAESYDVELMNDDSNVVDSNWDEVNY